MLKGWQVLTDYRGNKDTEETPEVEYQNSRNSYSAILSVYFVDPSYCNTLYKPQIEQNPLPHVVIWGNRGVAEELQRNHRVVIQGL